MQFTHTASLLCNENINTVHKLHFFSAEPTLLVQATSPIAVLVTEVLQPVPKVMLASASNRPRSLRSCPPLSLTHFMDSRW